MWTPRIDSFVALKRDRPDLGLRVGDAGVVRGIWSVPGPMCDVEFVAAEASDQQRSEWAVLPVDQIAPAPLKPHDPPPGPGRTLYF